MMQVATKRLHWGAFAWMLVCCPLGTTAADSQSACSSGACKPTELQTLKQLPPEVLSYLIDDPHSPKGIADRDGKYNATDVITNPPLPMRRFVLAGVSPDRLVVEVERGGYSHYYQALEFHLSDHHWVYASRKDMLERIDDVSSLFR
jgi:hypothetical protein